MPRPLATVTQAAAGRGRGRPAPRRPGPGPDHHDDVQVQFVWQCAVCMSVFSKLNSVKYHLIHTSTTSTSSHGHGPSHGSTSEPPARARARGSRTGGPRRGSHPPGRRCGEIAAAFARRKSVAAGQFIHVFDVAIAQWSIRNSSNARFAGGMATRTMISGDRELYDSSLSALQEGQQTKVICCFAYIIIF